MKIPVGISKSHVHLSSEDRIRIFGNTPLTKKRDLKQPGEYVCNERLSIQGPNGLCESLAIVGPDRPHTQVELTRSVAKKLGFKDLPVNNSGDFTNAQDVDAYYGVKLRNCVIIARMHVHSNAFRDTQVFVDIHNAVLKVPVKPGADEFHIDEDEAMTFGLENGDMAEVC